MDFTQFFDKMESQESYTILFITIVGFLFGLLVGFLLRTAKVRRLKKELKAAASKASEAENQLTIVQQELEKKSAELETAQAELRDVIDKMGPLEADKEKLYNQVYTLNTDLEKLQATNRTYSSTIEELSDQIVGLKTQNEQLAEELEAAQSAPQSQGGYDNLQSDTLSRLEIFEAKLDKLTAENELLKARMGGTSTIENASTGAPLVVGALTGGSGSEEAPDLGVSKEKAGLNKKIITNDVEKDDLTQIGGVGPFIQKQLYDAGIHTYEQISLFDDPTIEKVTRQIGYFPGRIKKDDWVGQAKKLMKAEKSPAKAKKTNKIVEGQDLKIIEGIGPKIESILKAAGINNWTELSAASNKRLRTILDEAGSRYKMHDPKTWSEQATLAANGKWEELEKMQDNLKGGRS